MMMMSCCLMLVFFLRTRRTRFKPRNLSDRQRLLQAGPLYFESPCHLALYLSDFNGDVRVEPRPSGGRGSEAATPIIGPDRVTYFVLDTTDILEFKCSSAISGLQESVQSFDHSVSCHLVRCLIAVEAIVDGRWPKPVNTSRDNATVRRNTMAATDWSSGLKDLLLATKLVIPRPPQLSCTKLILPGRHFVLRQTCPSMALRPSGHNGHARSLFRSRHPLQKSVRSVPGVGGVLGPSLRCAARM